MERTDLLRQLNQSLPDVVERSITLWGSGEHNVYLSVLISDAAKGTDKRITESAIVLLSRLKALHDREYPQLSAQSAPVCEKLAQNKDFRTINARFPHIGKRLAECWGHKSFGGYVDSLMNDTRGGTRRGFPPDVAFSLFHLSEAHSLEYPQFDANSSDAWELS